VLSSHRHHRGAVSGIVFTSSSTKMFTCSCDSTLAMYDVTSLKMIKLLGNTVVTRMGVSPGVITLDHNDNKLAVVGPLPHTITILDADNLNEVIHYVGTSIAVLYCRIIHYTLLAYNSTSLQCDYCYVHY